MREIALRTAGEQRPAGVPSVKNRFDNDWMHLTKNDRPSSVPSRISRFTARAPTDWRHDNSTFEYDKPVYKRSGSRKSAKSDNVDIYPDWWGDGSAYASQSSYSRSRSRGRNEEYEKDDFDRKVTFKDQRKKILKQPPTKPVQPNYVVQTSNETTYEDESPSEGEYTSEAQSEEKPRRQERHQERHQESRQGRRQGRHSHRLTKPVATEKQMTGIIYSKLHTENEEADRENEHVRTKQSKNGYAMSFSPVVMKEKKKAGKENMDSTHHNKQNKDDNRHKKTYVKQSQQYEKPAPKQHKGKSMKELKVSNHQKALEKRAKYDHDRKENEKKRKIPKSLQGVESVIKKRVQIDKEINKRRKQDQLESSLGAESVVSHKGHGNPMNQDQLETSINAEIKPPHKSHGRHKKERKLDPQPNSRANADNRTNEQNDPGQTYFNLRQKNNVPIQHDNEESSYPSVTQAIAPQEYYNRNQQYQRPEQQYQISEQQDEIQAYPGYQYRPSTVAPNIDREGNVADIADGFLNSPMMTQFSDNSEMQRRPYTNMQSHEQDDSRKQDDGRRQEDSRRQDDKDYSRQNDSYNYGQYPQNMSSDSITANPNPNPYDNKYPFTQTSNNKQNSGPVSNSNANYSRYNEDQVLFKSNGFDGNATSSGKADESAMLQSPVIQNRPAEQNSDSKLTGTANFERPKDYDVKYSDYRRNDPQKKNYK
jgi:hypothetical protein